MNAKSIRRQRDIISNKNSLFTNHFWLTLCWHLNARRQFNIAFHSQINDQIEKQNQMLKHYLRVYYNYKQNNWSKLLSMTAFAYNNNVHSNINRAFNELFKDYVADFANEFEDRFIRKKTFLIIERAEWLRSNREYLREL